MKGYRKLLVGLGGIFVIAALVVNIYLFPTPDRFPEENFKSPILIAHAGGIVDSLLYTNSREAVEQAAKDGYKFIELDLLETSDYKVGAMHTYADFNEFTGYGRIDLVVDSKEFKTRKLFNCLHPLLGEDINNFFTINKDLLLVTDKIQDFDLLNKYISFDKERMLVEVFTYKSYAEALRKGIRYPMLSIWDQDLLDHYMKYIYLRKVKMIAIPVKLIAECPKKLIDLRKMGVSIFTFDPDITNLKGPTNDKEFILKYGGSMITGFYTDFVKNKDLE